jgi:hypothetical protein
LKAIVACATFRSMIVMQRRTYHDGTTWLRWLEATDEVPRGDRALPRSNATDNCAACHSESPDWIDAPNAALLPKVDLIYECAVCGRTTFQGRLGTER